MAYSWFSFCALLISIVMWRELIMSDWCCISLGGDWSSFEFGFVWAIPSGPSPHSCSVHSLHRDRRSPHSTIKYPASEIHFISHFSTLCSNASKLLLASFWKMVWERCVCVFCLKLRRERPLKIQFWKRTVNSIYALKNMKAMNKHGSVSEKQGDVLMWFY